MSHSVFFESSFSACISDTDCPDGESCFVEASGKSPTCQPKKRGDWEEAEPETTTEGEGKVLLQQGKDERKRKEAKNDGKVR